MATSTSTSTSGENRGFRFSALRIAFVSRPTDPTPADYRARIEAGADEVDTLIDQLQDARDRRNGNIVDALEHGAGNMKAVASWARLSKPQIENIMAST